MSLCNNHHLGIALTMGTKPSLQDWKLLPGPGFLCFVHVLIYLEIN